MTTDRIDDLLVDHFRPAVAPPDLAARVAGRVRAAGGTLTRLLDRLTIDATARGLTRIGPGRAAPAAGGAARRHVEQAHAELREYLGGQRTFFSVPVDLSVMGDFQRRVLEKTVTIPFGEARPYAWVAAEMGQPRAVRAVGTALARNPIPLVIPCHRVLRSDGSLGGYSLIRTDLKQTLLGLERDTPLLEGCTTTRVVCRRGCAHLRRVRPDRRVVFASVADARSVGYRTCRVCRPAASA